MNCWNTTIWFQAKACGSKDHTLADGLPYWPRSPDDPKDPDNANEWIDNAYSFGVLLKIPQSNKVKQADTKVNVVKQFLDDPGHWVIKDEDFKKLIQWASEFFVLNWKFWRKDCLGKHKVVVEEHKWLELIRQAHDELGHKEVFTTRMRLGERFWWPHMHDDIKWYNKTCHECQVWLIKKIVIPPTISNPGGLFRKVYIDTMLMPKAKGYWYIIHARCLLTSYPEWMMVKNKNFKSIAKFIHENLLCRWGAIEIIVTDNAPQYTSSRLSGKNIPHLSHQDISI